MSWGDTNSRSRLQRLLRLRACGSIRQWRTKMQCAVILGGTDDTAPVRASSWTSLDRRCDHRQRVVSGSDATRAHGPIHTGTSPQFSGTQRRSQVRGRTANQRSHRRARKGSPSSLAPRVSSSEEGTSWRSPRWGAPRGQEVRPSPCPPRARVGGTGGPSRPVRASRNR
jgi:hypothetical protein